MSAESFDTNDDARALEHKHYEPLTLPARASRPNHEPPRVGRLAYAPPLTQTGQPFAEIEIGSDTEVEQIRLDQAVPAPGTVRNTSLPPPVTRTTRNLRSPQSPVSMSVPVPVPDALRERFLEMRRIALDAYYQRFDHTKIFYQREQRAALSKIFYDQAQFMRDFTDDYTMQVPFSLYFPWYQPMDFQQLRTYFSWRTRVRSGCVADASLSYAFIYVYELLNLIGADSPADALDKLTAFWKAYRVYDKTIDKYTLRWLKDFHVYYETPDSFSDFIRAQRLESFYPETYSQPEILNDSFTLYHPYAKYDITRSVFYDETTRPLIHGCFNHVMGRLHAACEAVRVPFDDLLLNPSRDKNAWYPFEGALFYSRTGQFERRVALSGTEIYVCNRNEWTCLSVEKVNKSLIGYILKRTEATLRHVTGYKHKLSANANMIDAATMKKIAMAGIPLDHCIDEAASAYYSEQKRTVVSVDQLALARIRREAMDIQEKLIVTETPVSNEEPPVETAPVDVTPSSLEAPSDPFTIFVQSLTATEYDGLRVMLQAGDLFAFAHTHGIMAEVFIDSLNQKAYDAINDTIFDMDGTLFPEYTESLTKTVITHA